MFKSSTKVLKFEKTAKLIKHQKKNKKLIYKIKVCAP